MQNHRVFASILGEVGIDMPPEVTTCRLDEAGGIVLTELRGNHLTPRLFDDPSFLRDLRAIYELPYTLVEASGGAVEIFDLERDPDELADLASGNAELVSTLSERLAAFAARHPPLYEEEAEAALRPDTEEALRALGYIEWARLTLCARASEPGSRARAGWRRPSQRLHCSSAGPSW